MEELNRDDILEYVHSLEIHIYEIISEPRYRLEECSDDMLVTVELFNVTAQHNCLFRFTLKNFRKFLIERDLKKEVEK
jgi:hypothetical protein